MPAWEIWDREARYGKLLLQKGKIAEVLKSGGNNAVQASETSPAGHGYDKARKYGKFIHVKYLGHCVVSQGKLSLPMPKVTCTIHPGQQAFTPGEKRGGGRQSIVQAKLPGRVRHRHVCRML